MVRRLDPDRLDPVVRRRRKKSARSEECVRSGNLNVNNKRRSWVRYRKMDGIPGI